MYGVWELRYGEEQCMYCTVGAASCRRSTTRAAGNRALSRWTPVLLLWRGPGALVEPVVRVYDGAKFKPVR